MWQIKEEIHRMIESKAVIRALVIPLVVAVIFCYIFSNNQILEAKVCIIDLDNSNYSRQMIDKLDASPYISVSDVVHTPIEPDLILADDYYKAVLSFPKGMEQNIYRNVTSNIGFIVDNTIMAGTSNLRQAVAEFAGSENAVLAMSKLKGRGLSTDQAAGLISNLSIQQRLMYNPTGDYINSTVFGFLSLFFLVLMLSSSVRIVPTLRQEGKLRESIDNPIGLISRIIPYSILYMISSLLSLGILKQFGSLRFAGNFAEFLLPLFLFTFVTGMLGLLISWSAADPDHVTGRMISLVFPSFILSNIIFPIDLMPKPIWLLSQCLPLNWYARFFRAIGLRGVSLVHVSEYLGGFFLLTAITLMILFSVMLRSGKKIGREEPRKEALS